MLVPIFLLPFAHLAPSPDPAPDEGSLLATVPDDAYALVHCRDVLALRGRAERNDWYRLLGSSHGEPILSALAHEIRRGAHCEMEDLLAIGAALEGEVVFFDTGTVAGFAAEPPRDRAALSAAVRAWMPEEEVAAHRSLELGGGTAQLVAWPDEIDGWTGRAGHYAAFVDHPQALAIYSGDDLEALRAVLSDSVRGLATDRRAPLVASYLAAGGGQGGGIEAFVDFTPLVDQAEAALKEAVEGVLPDPSRLLGLQEGTWLHASADVYPGTRVDCQARLRVPPDTLAASLADTFRPLPHALPADLPRGVWCLWALDWDVKVFYQRVREAYEEAGLGEGLQVVDAGIDVAKGVAGVDPVVDVLNQLAGDFAVYFVDPPQEEMEPDFDGMEELASLGFQAGLLDGEAFLSAFETLIEVGDMGSAFDLEEIAGVDAYVVRDDGADGGVAFLPDAFAGAPSRRVLERSLRALTGAEDASLLDGSRMQAAIDENAGACFLTCVEMTPLRAFLPELDGDLRLPPLEEGQPARDPFDAQLVGTVRRAPEGFELRLHTR